MTVKLYGTLGRCLDGYDHSTGLALTVSGGMAVQDLLAFLNLQPEGIGMVFMNDQPAKMDTCIKKGAKIKLFHPIFGG